MKCYKITNQRFTCREVAIVVANSEQEAKELLLNTNYFSGRDSDYWEVKEIKKPNVVYHYLED